MGPPMRPGEQKTTFESLFIHQGTAGLDGGGEVEINRFNLEIGSTWSLQGGHALGVDLNAGRTEYDFSGLGGGTSFAGGSAPWEQVERYGIDLSYRRILDREQSFFLMPTIEFSRAEGADWGDSLRWGAIAGYMRQFSPDLALGIGGAVFTGLEDTTGFPVLFINWEFAENWRLSNPFRPGPSGPAGLEVVYDGLDRWEFGFGGGWRNQRFLLDDQGLAPEGYGENEGVAAFLRATYSLNPSASFDFYAGSLLNGELSLEDAAGNRLAETDYDSTLVGAVALTLEF